MSDSYPTYMNRMNERITPSCATQPVNFLDAFLKSSILQSPHQKTYQSSDELHTDIVVKKKKLYKPRKKPAINEIIDLSDCKTETVDVKPIDTKQVPLNIEDQITNFVLHKHVLEPDKDTTKSCEVPHNRSYIKSSSEPKENQSQTIRFVFLEPQELPMLVVETSKFEAPKQIVFEILEKRSLQTIVSKWFDCNCCINSNNSLLYAKTYSCSYCPYKSDNIYILQQHKSEFHKLILPLIPCQYCDFQARTSLELQSHTYVHYELLSGATKMFCDLCAFWGTDFPLMEKHFNEKHFVFQVPYVQCGLCPNQNVSMKILKVHSFMCHKFHPQAHVNSTSFKLGMRRSITVPQNFCLYRCILNGVIKTVCVFCPFHSDDEEQVLEHIIVNHSLIHII